MSIEISGLSVEVSGLMGLLWLIVSVWAIVKTLQSSAGTGKKTVWVLLILLLPVIGLVGWLLIGPKR